MSQADWASIYNSLILNFRMEIPFYHPNTDTATGTFYRGSTKIVTDPLLMPLGNYSNSNPNIIDNIPPKTSNKTSINPQIRKEVKLILP
jgi:hypothetical protein